MTSTPVSDATLFFSNISTKNQNVTGLGSASESFSEVMNKTSNHNVGAYSQQNQVADTSEDTGKVSGKGEDLESENRIQEEPTEKVDKAEKSTDVEETQNTDETAETVKDELEEKAEELVQEIAKELGVSVEEVEKVLDELGISLMGLFDKENLTQVVVVLSGAEDVTQIVMDEELFAQVNKLLGTMEEMLTEVSQSTDVTVEELMEYVSREEFKETVQVIDESDKNVSKENAVMDEMEVTDAKETVTENSENVDNETEKTVKVEVSETERSTSEHAENGQSFEQTESNNQFLTNVTNNTLQNSALNAENGMSPYLTFEAREIMQQILDYIKVQVKPDMTSLQMQLHPEDLGTL